MKQAKWGLLYIVSSFFLLQSAVKKNEKQPLLPCFCLPRETRNVENGHLPFTAFLTSHRMQKWSHETVFHLIPPTRSKKKMEHGKW